MSKIFNYFNYWISKFNIKVLLLDQVGLYLYFYYTSYLKQIFKYCEYEVEF